MAKKKIKKSQKINWNFGEKHKNYIRLAKESFINVAEGAVRAGKTVDNIFAFAMELERHPDKIHVATGSKVGNAKLNIGDGNGFGLEHIFRGRSRWGRFKDNECLYINTISGEKVVIFAGAGKADSYKGIRGNSYGMWIATEINHHHDDAIKECFNRTLMSSHRKVFWDLNPVAPTHPIYTKYIDKYLEASEAGEFAGGYNFQNFTIYDNINLTKERMAQIESQYDKTSTWYKRDILGQRATVEGAIYKKFVADIESFEIAKEDIGNLRKITIGIDFGEGPSKHAFVATGLDAGPENLYVLSSRRLETDLDPSELAKAYVDFLREVEYKYGYVNYTYYDSAIKTVPRGLATELRNQEISRVLAPAYKGEIIDRIKAVELLIAQGRFWYTKEAYSVRDALSNAVWDPKHRDGEKRYDHPGITDIDSLDAFEYSFTRDIGNLVDYGKMR